MNDLPETSLLFDHRHAACDLTRPPSLLKHGLGELRLPSVVGFTLVDNAGSRRVLEKSGLVYERAFEHAGLPHVLYRIRADR